MTQQIAVSARYIWLLNACIYAVIEKLFSIIKALFFIVKALFFIIKALAII